MHCDRMDGCPRHRGGAETSASMVHQGARERDQHIPTPPIACKWPLEIQLSHRDHHTAGVRQTRFAGLAFLRAAYMSECARGSAMQIDRLWTGGRIATLDPSRPGLGVIEDGAVAARDGRIAWVGARSDLPAWQAADHIDLQGRWVTPGLVDCHTHLVYGGNRA